MCVCNPIVKTPFCGKPGCEWPPQLSERLLGTVTRTVSDKGFGFIAVRGRAGEYFFHKSATAPDCRDARDFLTLIAGDRVSFAVNRDAPKGPRAEDVRLELPGV